MEEAHRLKTKYASQISLLVGVETEHIHDSDLSYLSRLLLGDQKTKIDMVVGSIHHVNQIPIDFDKPSFERALRSCVSPALETYLISYLDAQNEMIMHVQPEVIGHFDLFRLYTPELELSKEEHPKVWERIERNIQLGISYGALFEVNAAAFRKGWSTAYPGRDILKVSRHFHALGSDVLTLPS